MSQPKKIVALQNETGSHASSGIPEGRRSFRIRVGLPLSLFTRWSWSGGFLRTERCWVWKLNSRSHCFSRGIYRGLCLSLSEAGEEKEQWRTAFSSSCSASRGELWSHGAQLWGKPESWVRSLRALTYWERDATPLHLILLFISLHKFTFKVVGLHELNEKFLE